MAGTKKLEFGNGCRPVFRIQLTDSDIVTGSGTDGGAGRDVFDPGKLRNRSTQIAPFTRLLTLLINRGGDAAQQIVALRRRLRRQT